MIFDLFVAVITSILLVMAFITILNTFTFPRLSEPDSIRSSVASSALPAVSVCIPARNESAVIAATIRAWLGQDYPAFEILLLDDHSDDGTAQIARNAAQGDPRLRIIQGQPLPPGWKGKNWACHQLSQHASGEFLIFTDADVRWQPGALSRVLTHFRVTRADLLTIWPTQQTVTWGERLVVPLMALTIMSYLPILAVHYVPWAIFAAANGQCLVFNRIAYNKVGGHLAVKSNIVEDMGFAYSIKKKKMRLRMADGGGVIVTCMYHNWRETRDGFAKNILGGHANSVPFLVFSTLFHWAIFIFPVFWFVFSPSLSPLLLFALGILIRALTAAATRQRIADALFMPVSTMLMTAVAARALQWHFGAGPQWKGRNYARS